MADPNAADALLNDFNSLRIHPTGSGSADLETAYEQMRLAEGTDIADSALNPSSASETNVQNEAAAPSETAAVEESAAHPS